MNKQNKQFAKHVALTVIWTIVAVTMLYQMGELSHEFYEVADSSPQQAAAASLRIAKMFLAYVLGRAATFILAHR